MKENLKIKIWLKLLKILSSSLLRGLPNLFPKELSKAFLKKYWSNSQKKNTTNIQRNFQSNTQSNSWGCFQKAVEENSKTITEEVSKGIGHGNHIWAPHKSITAFRSITFSKLWDVHDLQLISIRQEKSSSEWQW